MVQLTMVHEGIGRSGQRIRRRRSRSLPLRASKTHLLPEGPLRRVSGYSPALLRWHVLFGSWRCGESNLARRVSASPSGPRLSGILGFSAFPLLHASVWYQTIMGLWAEDWVEDFAHRRGRGINSRSCHHGVAQRRVPAGRRRSHLISIRSALQRPRIETSAVPSESRALKGTLPSSRL